MDGNRRFDVVMRLRTRTVDTGLGDLLIATPRARAAEALADDRRKPTGPTRYSARTPAPHRRATAMATAAATWPQIVADIRGVVAEMAAGLRHQPRGHVPGAGGGHAPHRRAVARLAGADLRRALQPLPLDGAGTHHHGRHPARPDRQRGRALIAGTALGGVDDRLHHAGRHLRPQRHP